MEKKKLGILLAKINFFFQILYIEIPVLLYEYYAVISFKLFVGQPDIGFDLLTGSAFRLGFNLDIESWSIGLNLIPFMLLYFLFLMEENQTFEAIED